jgi:hypothetical protein
MVEVWRTETVWNIVMQREVSKIQKEAAKREKEAER